MPNIPVYNQRANLQIQNPTGFQNASSAGDSYKELQQFGAVVSDTAVKMDKFWTTKKETDRAIKSAGMHTKATLESLRATEEVRALPPEKRAEAYFVSMQKRTAAILDGIEDPDVRADAAGIFDNQGSSQLYKVGSDAMNDSLADSDKALVENQNDRITLISSAPDKLEEIVTQSNKEKGSLLGIMDPVKAQKLAQADATELAKASVRSFYEGKDTPDFAAAEAQVTKAGRYLGADERKSLYDAIDSKKGQYQAEELRLEREAGLTPYAKRLEMDPTFKKRDTQADMLIKQATPIPGGQDPWSSESPAAMLRNNIMIYKTNEMERDPKQDPNKVARNAIKLFTTDLEYMMKIPTNNPKIDQNNEEDMKTLGAEAVDTYRKSKKTKKDSEIFEERKTQIMDRIRAIQMKPLRDSLEKEFEKGTQ